MHYVYILEMYGRRYYGVSQNPTVRLSNHRATLNSGLHPNWEMQTLWETKGRTEIKMPLVVAFDKQIDALKAEHLCIKADPNALNARKDFVVPNNLKDQVTVETITKTTYR